MTSPRESTCRNFKNNEKLFLNYSCEDNIKIGDIILWKGRTAEFDIITNLTNLHIEHRINERNENIDSLYLSNSGVITKFNASDGVTPASVHMKYRSSCCYTIQTHSTTIEYINPIQLATEITNTINTKNIEWDKKWIVITSSWKSKNYTQIVSGGKKAEAKITANPQINLQEIFNIANPDIGIGLEYSNNIATRHLATNPSAPPVFMGMKYRSDRKGIPFMARYGKDGILTRYFNL